MERAMEAVRAQGHRFVCEDETGMRSRQGARSQRRGVGKAHGPILLPGEDTISDEGAAVGWEAGTT